MLHKDLKEEQAPSVDKRLAKAVRIIVEQYDGDIDAFVESIRCQAEMIRRIETSQATGARWSDGRFEK